MDVWPAWDDAAGMTDDELTTTLGIDLGEAPGSGGSDDVVDAAWHAQVLAIALSSLTHSERGDGSGFDPGISRWTRLRRRAMLRA